MNKTPRDARAFVTVARPRDSARLRAFLHSCQVHHGETTPVHVVVDGDAERVRAETTRHPLGEALRVVSAAEIGWPNARGGALAALFLPRLAERVRFACVVNVDSVLLSSLDDVFADAERGHVVASATGGWTTLDDEHRAYDERLSGVAAPELTEGFACFDLRRHWDLTATWGFAATHARPRRVRGAAWRLPARHDFDALATLIVLSGKTPLLRPRVGDEWWFDSDGVFDTDPLRVVRREGGQLFVRNQRSGGRQRILPGSGVKWWRRSGRRRWGRGSARLACFRHFAARPSAPGKDEANATDPDASCFLGTEST